MAATRCRGNLTSVRMYGNLWCTTRLKACSTLLPRTVGRSCKVFYVFAMSMHSRASVRFIISAIVDDLRTSDPNYSSGSTYLPRAGTAILATNTFSNALLRDKSNVIDLRFFRVVVSIFPGFCIATHLTTFHDTRKTSCYSRLVESDGSIVGLAYCMVLTMWYRTMSRPVLLTILLVMMTLYTSLIVTVVNEFEGASDMACIGGVATLARKHVSLRTSHFPWNVHMPLIFDSPAFV